MLSRKGVIDMSFQLIIRVISVALCLIVAFAAFSAVYRAFFSSDRNTLQDIAAEIDLLVHGLDVLEDEALSSVAGANILPVSGEEDEKLVIFGDQNQMRALVVPQAFFPSLGATGSRGRLSAAGSVLVKKPLGNCLNGCVCKTKSVLDIRSKDCVGIDLRGVSVSRIAPILPYYNEKLTTNMQHAVNRFADPSDQQYANSLPRHSQLYLFMPLAIQLEGLRSKSQLFNRHYKTDPSLGPFDNLIYTSLSGVGFVPNRPARPVWPFPSYEQEARYSPALISFVEGQEYHTEQDEILVLYLEYVPAASTPDRKPRLLVTPYHPILRERKDFLFLCPTGSGSCTGFAKNAETGEGFTCEEQTNGVCRQVRTFCPHGPITEPCVCGDTSYSTGVCSYVTEAPQQAMWYAEFNDFSCQYIRSCEDYCDGGVCDTFEKRHRCNTDFCGIQGNCAAQLPGDMCETQKENPNPAAPLRVVDGIQQVTTRGPGLHSTVVNLSDTTEKAALIGFSSSDVAGVQTYHCPFSSVFCAQIVVPEERFRFFHKLHFPIDCDSQRGCICSLADDANFQITTGSVGEVGQKMQQNAIELAEHVSCEPITGRRIVLLGSQTTRTVTVLSQTYPVAQYVKDLFPGNDPLLPGMQIDQQDVDSVFIEAYVPENSGLPTYVRVTPFGVDLLQHDIRYGSPEGVDLCTLISCEG